MLPVACAVSAGRLQIAKVSIITSNVPQCGAAADSAQIGRDARSLTRCAVGSEKRVREDEQSTSTVSKVKCLGAGRTAGKPGETSRTNAAVLHVL